MVKAGMTAQEQRLMGKFFLYASFVMCVMGGGVFLFQVIGALLFHHLPTLAFPYPILVVPLVWIPTGITLMRLAPRRQQIEECRQAAVREANPALLAQDQPLPNAEALPLPRTIYLEPNWWRCGAFSLSAGLLVLVLMLLFTDVGSGSFLVSVVAALLFSLGVFIVFILANRQRLDVTNEGFTVQIGSSPAWHLGTVKTIRWEDARLFFIYPRLLSAQDRLPTAYELSSASVIVRWDRMRSATRFNLRTVLMKPAGPIEDYNRQMESLLSLIAAKTGLSLYDGRLPIGNERAAHVADEKG